MGRPQHAAILLTERCGLTGRARRPPGGSETASDGLPLTGVPAPCSPPPQAVGAGARAERAPARTVYPTNLHLNCGRPLPTTPSDDLLTSCPPSSRQSRGRLVEPAAIPVGVKSPGTRTVKATPGMSANCKAGFWANTSMSTLLAGPSL